MLFSKYLTSSSGCLIDRMDFRIPLIPFFFFDSVSYSSSSFHWTWLFGDSFQNSSIAFLVRSSHASFNCIGHKLTMIQKNLETNCFWHASPWHLYLEPHWHLFNWCFSATAQLLVITNRESDFNQSFTLNYVLQIHMWSMPANSGGKKFQVVLSFG